MGFSAERAGVCLEAVCGSEERAVELLLSDA
jgi:hypothetical protein